MLQELIGIGREVHYSNFVEIGHSALEVRIRFMLGVDGMPPQVKTEVILPPAVAKALITSLKSSIDSYENQIGPVYMPNDMSGIIGLFGLKEGDVDGEEKPV